MSNVILGDYVIEIRSLLGIKVYNENVKIQDVYKNEYRYIKLWRRRF